MKIYVLHENEKWTSPLKRALEKARLPWEDWNLAKGMVDLDAPPPLGVFYNRMSASSHTRGNTYAPEFANAVLNWLHSHSRVIFNDTKALALEINKIAQYTALKSHGILVPKTYGAIGKEAIRHAAKKFEGQFIIKPNRAGKGEGVKLFQSYEQLNSALNNNELTESRDGITLVQQYIESESPIITRVEYVGQKLLYAVQVDTSLGFELCPADNSCKEEVKSNPKFEIIPNFKHPLLPLYESFLKSHGIHVAGIELIIDKKGKTYTYDINTNTNYNLEAEEAAGLYGMDAIAGFLGRQLKLLMQKNTSILGRNRKTKISESEIGKPIFI